MIKHIRWIYERMMDNLSEAKHYAEMAIKCRAAGDKATADWCVSMAQTHIQFNATGTTLLEKALNDYCDAQLAPGVKAVYDELKGDLNKCVAEVRMMLETAGK